MFRLLPIVAFSILFRFALADDARVPAFKYELSMSSRAQVKTYQGVRTEFKPLQFRGNSLKKIPGDAISYPVHVMCTSTEDGVDVVAVEESAVAPRPEYQPERPEKSFYFEVKSIRLDSEGKVPVRIRFKDATDLYSLRYVNGVGLQLEAIDVKFGRIIEAGMVPEFSTLTHREGDQLWQCNPLTVSASKAGKPHWVCDIPMRGQPEIFSVLENVLFVRTTAGHSFYIMKDNGELLLYDASVMSGKNPSDDVLRLWQRDMGLTYEEREKRGFFRFIKAAVMLDEKRSIPLMLECVEEGQGLGEKCAAIAALEKFNDNPAFWPASFPTPPSFFLKRVGMKRVFPAEAAKAEREKWERVFKEQLPKQN